MYLTETEDIKKTWQEYTEEQKDPNDQNNNNGVIAHLEPDILESEVKWALGSITMNKVSEISRKICTFASLTMLKPLIVWITTNCGKFLKRWE